MRFEIGAYPVMDEINFRHKTEYILHVRAQNQRKFRVRSWEKARLANYVPP